MKRLMWIGQKDKNFLKRIAKRKGTTVQDEVHRILAYYQYVYSTASRLDIKKSKKKKVVKDRFIY